MPREQRYIIPIAYGVSQVRVRIESQGKAVTSFTSQLEALDNGEWKPVRRYDNAHGQPHVDTLDRRGRQIDKQWLTCSSNEALTLARADFFENWERYVYQFLAG